MDVWTYNLQNKMNTIVYVCVFNLSALCVKRSFY